MCADIKRVCFGLQLQHLHISQVIMIEKNFDHAVIYHEEPHGGCVVSFEGLEKLGKGFRSVLGEVRFKTQTNTFDIKTWWK